MDRRSFLKSAGTGLVLAGIPGGALACRAPKFRTWCFARQVIHLSGATLADLSGQGLLIILDCSVHVHGPMELFGIFHIHRSTFFLSGIPKVGNTLTIHQGSVGSIIDSVFCPDHSPLSIPFPKATWFQGESRVSYSVSSWEA